MRSSNARRLKLLILWISRSGTRGEHEGRLRYLGLFCQGLGMFTRGVLERVVSLCLSISDMTGFLV
jgi:hypothetical protein